MTTGSGTPPKYNPVKVGQALLREVIELHPTHLTVDELTQRIVADPADRKEVNTVTKAMSELRQSGLLHHRDDERTVEPTPAALHAFTLLAA
jgi:hypothetical protein